MTGSNRKSFALNEGSNFTTVLLVLLRDAGDSRYLIVHKQYFHSNSFHINALFHMICFLAQRRANVLPNRSYLLSVLESGNISELQ